ncbi:MAG: septal ring lytic transglycosylase RlpA family protein [Holophagales bacterium]|jgi:rare lipoprotein A (peptidoglycan hydrolase)|nr:septal ring lytic transglycosylase RlpA family protein [Holophagales bacterium]
MSNHCEQCSVNFNAAQNAAAALLTLPAGLIAITAPIGESALEYLLSLPADLLAITSSPNKFFQIHFKNIHIRLGPNLKPVFTGGFLRIIRKLTPILALLVAPFFCLYCAKPAVNRWVSFELAEREIDSEGLHRVFSQTGYASWYGGKRDGFSYKKTANGEIMRPDASTCAHPFLPFGTVVRVENLSNGKSAILRVNDRGPYIKGRIIDITPYAAEEIGIMKKGISKVRVRVIQDLVRTTRAFSICDAYLAAVKARPRVNFDLKQRSLSKLNLSKIAFENAELLETLPLNTSHIVKNIDISAIFTLFFDLARKHSANISQVAWTCFSKNVQDFEEIANRLKNRRSDPFINRIR